MVHNPISPTGFDAFDTFRHNFIIPVESTASLRSELIAHLKEHLKIRVDGGCPIPYHVD